MDLLERLNRRFGSWYEGLFGGADTVDSELRPKDILRRILAAMEDGRREGLDGQVYVPNAYTLRIAVSTEAERDYLRAFLSAEELATAVARTISQHGYRTRGALLFVIEEADPADPGNDRVSIRCRFDTTVAAPDTKNAVITSEVKAEMPPKVIPPPADPIDDEPGTMPAMFNRNGAVLATLLVRSGDGRSLEAFPVGPGGVVIGRSRQIGNDIVINDAQVSKRHGRVVWEGTGFVYYDENSTNGSSINETLVAPNRPSPLVFNDVLKIGGTTLTLRPLSGQSPHPAAAVSPAVLPPNLPYNGRKSDVALILPDGTRQPLASEMSIGRSVTTDIAVNGPGVSDKHARLRLSDSGKLTVEDLNTPGGTFVNSERIPPLFPVALRNDDEITFGNGSPFVVRIG